MNGDYVDLQTLIMFLVFEKQVLTMDDDASELYRYFKKQHNDRMNQELNGYKSKMNIEYGNIELYEVLHDFGRDYITAYNLEQAKLTAVRNNIKPKEVIICDESMPMMDGDVVVDYKDLIKGEPRLIGGFHR